MKRRDRRPNAGSVRLRGKPMSDENRYTIGELAEQAGVTPRTIRYYAAEGLLPPPDTRGRYALYGDDHLYRLRLIARLKEAFLPLNAIRARVERLTTTEVQEALAVAVAPPASSAVDYLAQISRQRSSAPAPLGYQPRHFAEARAPYPAPARGALPPAPEAEGLRASPPLQVGRVDLPAPPDGESWRHITLAPGVELHLREPLAPEDSVRVEQLLALARALFGDRR